MVARWPRLGTFRSGFDPPEKHCGGRDDTEASRIEVTDLPREFYWSGTVDTVACE